ncbi:MAG TPA: phosphoribosylformylglycinamidine cyclo-ligase [candidate division Zixibacteria bacterium]|nr:phosphoribosylformylglycinamidine cyclo-ligase [candidate division Zixibacteria bacterium]
MVLTYKKSGVDIKAASLAKKKIKALAALTFNPQVLSEIGSFGAFFNLDRKFKTPILVSSVDGVGTKLKVAFLANKHDTIGEDLVNHCVNDILVHGAKPLFFLDYIATGKLSPAVVSEIVKGLASACRKVSCALIGGETAQMPDFYQKNEYDLAGFIVGAVEKDKIIDGKKIKPGDQIIGLASNGLHTNGYSLARKVFFEQAGWKIDKYVPELKTTLKEELLKTHCCYFNSLSRVLESYHIKGMAHITGGGIAGNLVRILPQNCVAQIDTASWRKPKIFGLIQKLGKISNPEMFEVFNMGIGMILVVNKRDVTSIMRDLSLLGETVFHIGEIKKGAKRVSLQNL